MMRGMKTYPAWQWWMLGVGTLVAAVAIYAAPPAKPDYAATALATCQIAIKSVAKNPSAAKIPYARDIAGGDGFQFAWPHGSGLRLQNDFGAMIDASASCAVDSSGATVTNLSVNGETII